MGETKDITKKLRNHANRFVENDEVLDIDYMRGYKKSLSTSIIHYGLIILSAGILLLVYHWFPRWSIKMRLQESSLAESDYVYVKSKDKKYQLCKVTHLALGKGGLTLPSDQLVKMIEFKFTRLFYNAGQNVFERPEARTQYTRQEIAELCKRGLNTETYNTGRDLHGPNFIDVPMKSIPRLLMEEVLHPFFIFQIYSIGLWCAEAYYYYAGAILLIATISAGFTLFETRNNLKRLGEIARYKCTLTVLRNGVYEDVLSDSLVPGDIIEIKKSLLLPCDMTLLTGTVILNESMLTGESIPVTKYSLEECSGNNLSVDGNVNKRCAMSGGTMVVKTQCKDNEKILAMITKTSWLTTKGGLVLSMLYPKESHFKFFEQSVKFLMVLCGIALVGFAISVWRMLELKDEELSHTEIVIRALDLITIVVPPALPMAQSVGTGFSIVRLKAKKIFCISPPRVSMAGKIEVYCFDKTGTLTEDGLDLLGVLPVHNSTFSPIVTEFTRMTGPLVLTMATCHTLAYIDEQVSGDPLEEKIFKATNSHLNDTHEKYCATIKLEKVNSQSQLSPEHSYPISCAKLEESDEIALVDRFEFQSALQRMSVIVRGINSTSFEATSSDMAIVKGSPEMMKKLSVPESIPKDFDHVLSTYTKKGYRVLGCGYKEWTTSYEGKTKEEIREEAEKDLFFLGFIIMENKIKPETPPALKVLKDAEIRLIMVTGDNVLTAVSVSRECGIVPQDQTIFMSELGRDENGATKITWTDVTSPDEAVPYKLDTHTLTVDNGSYDFDNYSLAVTGDCWKVFYEDFKLNGPSIAFNQILKKGSIFARMTPDQKQNLVEELQAKNLYVGMCGDGANDCGALKAAHVGISLSLAEASIAAPFTSTITNVSCTHNLIREGRASLAVSFKLFQFIGMYSLIQFSQVILLYVVGSVLTNFMYLYQDLWLIFPLVIFMGRTEPCTKLAVKRPSSRLISVAVIGSLLTQVALVGAFLSIVFVAVQREKWYKETGTTKSTSHMNEEQIHQQKLDYICASLFVFGNFQYSIMALIYSWGKPFLKPIYTNRFLFGCFFISLATSFICLFVPIGSFVFTGDSTMEWKLKLLVLLAINYFVAIACEMAIIFFKNRYSQNKRKQKRIAARQVEIKGTVNEQYSSIN